MASDLKTGTTTVGLVAKECVVLAADMRASLGHIAYDEENQKLSQITRNIGLTNAGSVGDTMTIVRFLKSQAKLYELENENEIPTKALVTFLANVLSGNRYVPYEVQFVVAGTNPKPQLFEVTPFGAVLERSKYAVSGSGTELALNTLDLNYKEGMEENEAIGIAIQAVMSGQKRDIFSGGKSVSVMVIDKNGGRFVSSKTIEKAAKEKANGN
jgi:proteasome beta subunit